MLISRPVYNNASNPNDEVRIVNLQEYSSIVTLNPDTIPTLVESPVLKKKIAADKDPIYKVQKMSYPLKGNWLIYGEDFFKSFLSKLERRPIPGSKSGHTWSGMERPPTDFYLIGGKIESKGDGTGDVYFKNYIPKRGDKSDNDRFIEDLEMNMVHFSLVTYPDILEVEDPATGVVTRTAISSRKGERNDAVEYDLGAMKQETNAARNGGSKTNTEEKPMGKDELLKAVKNMLENGTLSVAELAKSAEIEDKIVNAEHTQGLELAKAFQDAGVKEPVAEFNAMKKKLEENAVIVHNAVLDSEFGASAKDATGAETNALRECAEFYLKDTEPGKLDESVKAFKNSAAARSIAGNVADINNAVNVIESKPAANAAATEATEKEMRY